LAIIIRPDLAERERRRDDPPTRRRSFPEMPGYRPVTRVQQRIGTTSAERRSRALPPPLDRHHGSPLPAAFAARKPVFEVEDFSRRGGARASGGPPASAARRGGRRHSLPSRSHIGVRSAGHLSSIRAPWSIIARAHIVCVQWKTSRCHCNASTWCAPEKIKQSEYRDQALMSAMAILKENILEKGVLSQVFWLL
jgi:hypothetical protein